MRIYEDLYACIKETQRNLWEMGINVNLKSMQNIKGDFQTKELLGETFRILFPFSNIDSAYKLIFSDVTKIEQQLAWVTEEFNERINIHFTNPGIAWELRKETWTPFMKDGKFEYTYNERLNPQTYFDKIVKHLNDDNNSRRVVINIYDSSKDLDKLETVERVPCSVTYSFLIREGLLNMFYHMRSSDFYTHFINDIHLAALFQKYLALHIDGVKPGWLQMSVNSLHAYKEDLIKRNIF